MSWTVPGAADVKAEQTAGLPVLRVPDECTYYKEDAGKMLIDAIKRAGSADPEKIQKALEETKDLQVGTGKITMDQNHNPIKSAVILEMKNGIKEMKAKIQPEG